MAKLEINEKNQCAVTTTAEGSLVFAYADETSPWFDMEINMLAGTISRAAKALMTNPIEIVRRLFKREVVSWHDPTAPFFISLDN